MSVIQFHLKRWGLQPDGANFETHTSHLMPVLLRDKTAMLKVFKPNSDETASCIVLRHFAGSGVPDVYIGDATALVLERVGPKTLLDVATETGDRPALSVILEVVAQLHNASQGNVPGAIPLRRWFQALFERESESPCLGRCATMARMLLDGPRDQCLLHGDIHHANILESPRGWLAIDPKGLLGERAYEVANLFGNPLAHPEIFLDRSRMLWLARESAVRLGLDVTRVLQFAFAFAGLSASWPGEVDDPEPALRLRSADILEDILREGA